MFNRGNKKDKDHYPDFKDEKSWDNFRQNMEATADTHGTSEVLDSTFVPNPTDPNAVELFKSKNKFIYSVSKQKLKTDMGMSIIQNHETLCSTQQVWQELVHHQMTSTTGSMVWESIMAHLTAVKLDTSVWHGTYIGFIVNFQNKLREYKRISTIADHNSDDMK